MKYCDDANCPYLEGIECKLGFINPFCPPKSMADGVYGNWGCKMPKLCRVKFKKVKVKSSRSID